MSSLPPVRARSLDNNDPGHFTNSSFYESDATSGKDAANSQSIAHSSASNGPNSKSNNLPSISNRNYSAPRSAALNTRNLPLPGYKLSKTLDLSDEEKQATTVKREVRAVPCTSAVTLPPSLPPFLFRTPLCHYYLNKLHVAILECALLTCLAM